MERRAAQARAALDDHPTWQLLPWKKIPSFQ
jgi:hypothetical protein